MSPAPTARPAARPPFLGSPTLLPLTLAMEAEEEQEEETQEQGQGDPNEKVEVLRGQE